MINDNEILKIASEVNKGYTLDDMIKIAAEEFNQEPPEEAQGQEAQAQEGQQQQQSSQGGQAMPQEQAGQQGAPALPPIVQIAKQLGVTAAQEFLGPEIAQAAVSGHPEAKDIMARTAGQVAKAIIDSTTEGADAGQAPEGEGAQAEAPTEQQAAQQQQMQQQQQAAQQQQAPQGNEGGEAAEEAIANTVTQNSPTGETENKDNVVATKKEDNLEAMVGNKNYGPQEVVALIKRLKSEGAI